MTTFWKPEPRRHSGAWHSLIWPSVIYVGGLILYGHGAFTTGDTIGNTQAIGSALIVIGGELGTIGAVTEVFRKYLAEHEECNAFDWIGLLVSLIATLGNLFVAYSNLATIQTVWVDMVRLYGPFIQILCSGLDSYFSLVEFGFYNASWERRWALWNTERHIWQEQEQARQVTADVPEDSGGLPEDSADVPEIADIPAELIPQLPELTADVPEATQDVAEVTDDIPELPNLPKATIHDWRKLAAGLNGETATLTSASLVAILERNGFSAPSPRSCRNWAKATLEAYKAVA